MRPAALLGLAGAALALVAAAEGRRIIGTRGPDLLLGTLRADRIAALDGGDRIDVAGAMEPDVSMTNVNTAGARAGVDTSRARMAKRTIAEREFRGKGGSPPSA